jgi:DNA topoisomerase-2
VKEENYGDNESDELDLQKDAPKPDSNKSYGGELIDLVFNKKKAEERKTWMTNNLKKETFLDYSNVKDKGSLKYSQFINKEFILFSGSDCERSIPHIMDGFKPSQRKVLYACIKRRLKDEIKVAQLAGYIGEHSAYHHGEQSLHTTIIGMAQSFVGSNNVNLLVPAGQFGTRRLGGKDAASPRYIFTMLEKITRTIFHPDDDELLNYLSDDGMSIEPEHYMPVIPMILVNGSDGIGTGWSSKIPNYDPRQIISNIRKMIANEETEEMQPFYSGFKGKVSPDGPGKYLLKGIVERTGPTTIEVTELPVRSWTQDFKNMLDTMLIPGKNQDSADVKDFQEFHTDTTVKFVINAEETKIDNWEKLPKGGLYNKFKLTSSISTTNMHAFDTQHKIVKYESPEAILKTFFDLRMEYYVKRKELLVQKLRQQQKILSNKARFVEEVCSGELVVSSRKKAELLQDLQSRRYDLFDDKRVISEEEEEEEEEEEASISDLAKGYEYLLGMKIWSLTYEKAEELRAQLAERTAELEELEGTEPCTIWLRDLDAIEEALDIRDSEIAEAELDEQKAQKKTAKYQAAKQKKAAAAKKQGARKKDEWISEEESDDEMDFCDSDDEVMVKPMATKRHKPAVKAMAKPPTKAPKSKPASYPKVVPKVSAKPSQNPPLLESDDENYNGDMEISLMDRLKKKNVATTTKVASTFSSSFSLDSAKRPSPKGSVSAAPPKRAKTAAKPAAKVKKQVAKSKKENFIDSDSEDEFDFDVGSNMKAEEVAPPAASSRSRRAPRASAKKSYVDDSFMDSDDGSDSDF